MKWRKAKGEQNSYVDMLPLKRTQQCLIISSAKDNEQLRSVWTIVSFRVFMPIPSLGLNEAGTRIRPAVSPLC